ncbi:MAG TPA: flagellar biosynthetic protein FliR [Jatrophihabitans sp.]|nr:flagellar biosynthetic protein FliR [Jatrophihabitans sp.]
MNLTIGTAQLLALLLCSLRIAAWLEIAPPLATAGVPRVVRLMLSGAISLAVSKQTVPHVPAAELGPIVASAAEQLLIGAALGFITRLLFSAVEAAGSLIDLSGGFSLAAVYDPTMQNNTSIFGRFYGVMASALLFASNAHLVIFEGFLRTFSTLPLDGTISLAHLDQTLVGGMTSMFVSCLQVAAPLIAVLFLADVALGLLSRISPQLNVFQMSFPLKIMLTLGLVGLSFAIFPQVINGIANSATSLVMRVAG